jgi:hypothetical protein
LRFEFSVEGYPSKNLSFFEHVYEWRRGEGGDRRSNFGYKIETATTNNKLIKKII